MDKLQVDARKLQLLNDRINQTIDALQQLRATAGYGSFAGSTSPCGSIGPSHSSWIDPNVAA